MSWFSPLRVLGVCGVWLAVQTGCGGNPSVSTPDDPTVGGKDGTGGSGATAGSGGSIMIGFGGEGDVPGEGGAGATPAGTYVCGNKALEPGEFCDDGNTANGDGCSGDCKDVDLDYDCSTIGEPCIKVVICGNGVLEGSEACDDGNLVSDDGCSADCKMVEDGFVCIRPGQACVELPVCGNGKREPGEACDDGQLPATAGDGCDDLCQIEPDYYCPLVGQACVKQVCGDGVRTPGEACDDGNTKADDGCAANCKTVETGWHCNAMGCKAECGDGLMKGAEKCDDGNAIGGDGCSSGCKVEPFFECSGTPSVCAPKQTCGNNILEPIFTKDMNGVWTVTAHEICEPPSAATGCNADCRSVTVIVEPPVCGNNVIEGTEKCDPPAVGQGCAADCTVETGFTCPQPGVCFANPICGDGNVNPGEACDDKNKANGDGCSSTCTVESGYTCVGLGPSVCVKPVCGNSAVETNEECDDGNAVTTDGCNACKISTGWVCPSPGAPCIAKCGDGLKLGTEACDDGNKISGDGCSAGCKIEPGFKCPTQNQKCVASVCGDGTKDDGEGCDDGNKVAGDSCGPTCQKEPTVTVGPNPTVNVSCGDGLKTGTEACDDGNTSSGDGCSSTCTIEPGYKCSAKLTLPGTLDMRVTYRDFKSANALTAGGHPDFQYNTFQQVRGITGDACTSANAATCGRLDSEGKPVLIRTGQQDNATGTTTGTGIMNANTFSLWYRNTNPNNYAGYNGAIQITPFTKTLTLTQAAAGSEVYSYTNGDFYPLNGAEGFKNIGAEVANCTYVDNNDGGKVKPGVRNQHNDCGGCDDACKARNYGFSSELRYFFQYKGGETLTFRGDDDVWVYVNGKLAVDLGGLHQQLDGQVVLGDDGTGGGTDSNCSSHGTALPDPAGGCYTTAEANDNTDSRFGLTKGGVYEIVLFHAERHSSASNFKLTLAGFLAPRSFCETECGDGVIAGSEFCDDGAANSNSVSGACKTDCTIRNFCGDGDRQSPGEACDNGKNIDVYKTPTLPATGCAPGCKLPASCGDGTLQASYEECDKGNANNDNAYGKDQCKKDCTLGGFCGDLKVQNANGETCDLGTDNGKGYGPNSCGYDCKAGRRCGDGIINDGSEVCDDGAMNGAITSHCSTSCALIPYCGDGAKQASEQCDWGQFAMDPPEYGGCSTMCTSGPSCGDGHTDPEEECDNGAQNNNDTYNGCTKACSFGPRCGDGVKQTGEVCDNGFNEDDYNDPKTPQEECGKDCKAPPFCGDGVLQSAHELCDKGAANTDDDVKGYDGCTTKCEYGPFCGDGDVNGPEICDDGKDNVTYSPKKGGCGYDCQLAPYCGDGVRNGPEQCDLGTTKNTGDYGTCNADCSFAPRCGDKKVDKGEECDDGPTGSMTCLASCKRRPVVQ